MGGGTKRKREANMAGDVVETRGGSGRKSKYASVHTFYSLTIGTLSITREIFLNKVILVDQYQVMRLR